MLPMIAIKSYEVNPLKIAQAADRRGDASWDPPAVRRLNHREHRVTQGMTQTTSTEILRFSCETLCPLWLLRFLFHNPLVGAGFEQIERQSPAVKHLVVEFSQIELRP